MPQPQLYTECEYGLPETMISSSIILYSGARSPLNSRYDSDLRKVEWKFFDE
jgi:hypothetical protein